MESDSVSMSSSQLTRSTTELSQGLSSRTQGLVKAINDQVDPLLQADLKDTRTVAFEKFLDALSPPNIALSKDKITSIIQETEGLFGKYISTLSKRNERLRYEPFCNLANRILGLLHEDDGQSAPPVIFARNDPRYIHGNFKSLQSPDVVVVRNGMAPLDTELSAFVPLDLNKFVYQQNDADNHTEDTGKQGIGAASGGIEGDAEKDDSEAENEEDDGEEVTTKDDKDVDARTGELSWIDVLYVFEFRKASSKKESTSKKQATKGRRLPSSGSSSSRTSRSNVSGPGKRKADSSLFPGVIGKKAKESYEDYMTKLARYCVHQFSSVFHRRHFFSALVLGRTLLMTYHDRGGAIRSGELEFIVDRDQFIRLIHALARLSPCKLGFVDAAKLAGETECAPIHADDSFGNLVESSKGLHESSPQFVVEMQQRPVMVLHELVRRPPFGLIGRGCRVHRAKIIRSLHDSDPKEDIALKASWQLARRKPEWEMISDARKGLSTVVAKKRPPSGADKSLPTVYLHARLDELLGDDMFRHRIGVAEGFQPDSNRIWNLMALELLETHLHKVEDEMKFKKCFREIFHAHYWVYTTTSILHRDISTQNLMVRNNRDGSMTGVLIDWDLAECKNSSEAGPRTGTRTGTRIFMAHELLEDYPPAHILRFDWESFFYYLMWVAFVLLDKGFKDDETQRRKDNNEKTEDMGSQLEKWTGMSNDELRHAKRYVVTKSTIRLYEKSVHKFHPTFMDWIKPMANLFGESLSAASEQEFVGEENETIGGILTYDKFSGILNN